MRARCHFYDGRYVIDVHIHRLDRHSRHMQKIRAFFIRFFSLFGFVMIDELRHAMDLKLWETTDNGMQSKNRNMNAVVCIDGRRVYVQIDMNIKCGDIIAEIPRLERNTALDATEQSECRLEIAKWRNINFALQWDACEYLWCTNWNKKTICDWR